MKVWYLIAGGSSGSKPMVIDRVLASGPYLRVSDYLREIIRRDLRDRGLLSEPGVKG